MRVLLFLMLCLWSMSSSYAHQADSTIDSSVTAIEFHFHDSAVPPLFHRSYDLHLFTDTTSYISVRSYQDYLAKRPFELDSLGRAHLDSLMGNRAALEAAGNRRTPGAVGGRRYSLQLHGPAGLLYELEWDSLQNLDDATEHFIEHFHRLLPKAVREELYELDVRLY